MMTRLIMKSTAIKNLVLEIGKLLFQYICLKHIPAHSFVLEFKLYHAVIPKRAVVKFTLCGKIFGTFRSRMVRQVTKNFDETQVT